ncbi:CBM35 domain-containing protein [Streptomyces sp. NPDC088400]|uniref:CBM35 domain-containing protein n=1 Tax=Streptomyces sp. NPDC088400 TaxID=3365861 RepID=UPI0038290AC8
MTAGNNGASKPEDDDPFGYLYEDGQAAGGNQQRRQGGYGYPGPAAQPGVPRTSYNQVRTVGERQYGQQAPVPQQAPYGQQQTYGQQQAYGQAPYGQQGQQGQQPNAHYAAPETQPGGGGPSTRQVPAQRGSGGGGRGGPNTKVLLSIALAVVAVVVVGIGIALATSDDKTGEEAGPSASPSAGQSEDAGKPSDAATDKEKEPVDLPKQDAATLKLTPPAAAATDIAGAKSESGAYVSLNGVGAATTWTVDVPEAGPYTLAVTYGVPGKDAKTSLSYNGGKIQSLNMSNFARAAEGDWAKGWTNTFAYINLDKGSNTIKISCEQGDQCEANLDQLQLKAGHVKG